MGYNKVLSDSVGRKIWNSFLSRSDIIPGQATSLQIVVSVAFPSQFRPPFDAAVATGLSRDFSPLPHVTEQDDHSP